MKPSEVYNRLRQTWQNRPDDILIQTETKTLTAREFFSLVEQIAKTLPAGTVFICLPHDERLIATIFAALKNNCTFVLAEPDFPPQRKAFMQQDAKANKEPYAYILYTSGTTGAPKGVRVKPENLLHYVDAFQDEFHITEQDIMLQHSVCTFDIFMEEVFASLLNGARLLVCPAWAKQDGPSLLRFLEMYRPTMLSGFPYLLQDLDGLGPLPSSMRLLISGGDVLRDKHIHNLKQLPDIMIYNTYGPSETTVCCTYQRCDNIEPMADGTYPVGHAVKGTSVTLAEDGEILIEGGGVSAGYGPGHPENEAFETLPDGTVRYHSGDLGRWLPDGTLHFLCRKDRQVMILGRRVELQEVENVLSGMEEIADCTVQSGLDDAGLVTMTGYVCTDLPIPEVKDHLEQFLPGYMIPETFVQLDRIPRTTHGKVDTNALRHLHA